MGKSSKSPILIPVVVAVIFGIAAVYAGVHHAALLDTQGLIAHKERDLMLFALLLSLLVVVPVFGMTIYFVWKYRENNTSAKYQPDWDTNKIAETIWWLIPTLLIVVLSVVTWNSSHDLDPYKPIVSNVKPVNVQVVALQWKWLFIYPEQHVASINLVEFPKDTPVNFHITADAPMNSFWIPQLSGQIYAMNGMSTQLHIMTSNVGSYRGVSANISGTGFAGMTFTAKATSQADYNKWMQSLEKSPNHLTLSAYNNLVKPTQNNPIAFYSSSHQDLYNTIVMKYLGPSQPAKSATPNMAGMQNMDMNTNDMDMQ